MYKEMVFEDKFFEDEVRDGFYVPGLMKSGWAAQLQVLSEIDRVCKKHGITWFAEYGTMLGAVRHNGFIPWDDDLDICMLRPDYMKFCQVAAKELPKEYDVLSIFTDSRIYREYITRVNNSREISTEPEILRKRQRCPYVQGIDIFCLDCLPDDDEAAAKLRDEITLVGQQLKENEQNQKELHLQMEKLFSSIDEKVSSRVAIMADWYNSDGKRGYPKEFFDNVVYLTFENIKLPVPVGYDYILRDKYGDYMRLVRNGGGHDYRFQDQVKNFEKVAGPAPYKYVPDLNEIKTGIEKKEREKYRLPKHNIANVIKCFGGINVQIKQSIMNLEFEQVGALLSQYQNNVIEVGNLIDSLEPDSQVIHVLEDYCECIFECFTAINETVSGNINESDIVELAGNVYKKLQAACDMAVDAVLALMSQGRIVVFIPYKYETWEALKPVYYEEMRRSDTKVYVLMPPYYTKMPDGQRLSTFEDAQLLSKSIEVTDYSSFDFASMHPDVIYIQNPYDQYNFSISVHPFFYSSNLWKYTEKLVLVPYFKESDFSDNDERAYLSMDSYVSMPGMLYSDEVWLGSENIKNNYLRKLDDFINGYGAYFETKIKVMNQEHLVKPDRKSEKKVILFANSLSSLLEYGDKAIDKINRVLDTFKTSEIQVLWMPDINIDYNLERIDRNLYTKYNEILDKYKSIDNIKLVSGDNEAILSGCDAYYGDASVLAHKCRMMGKPVMIMNTEV